MPSPTFLTSIRQVLGRAFRETGQAIDRLGVQGEFHATKYAHSLEAHAFDIPLSRHRNIMPLHRRGIPQISSNVAFIAPCSSIIGNVTIGKDVSIWYGAVIRGDRCLNGLGHKKEKYEEWRELPASIRKHDFDVDGSSGGGGIYIGEGTNVQDGVIITSKEDHTTIGDNVTIGHSAQIHSANIGDNTLIGMGSIILEGCRIGSMALIGAGSVIARDTEVLDGELWVGNPAKKLRDLTEGEKMKLISQGKAYVDVANTHTEVMELGGNLPLYVKDDSEDSPPLIKNDNDDQINPK